MSCVLRFICYCLFLDRCVHYDFIVEAKIQSEEKNKEIVQNEEYLSTIEKERGKIISELAIKMQTKVSTKLSNDGWYESGFRFNHFSFC